jgi:glycosyltransferase involved in cell wall biosynthesis
MSAINFHSHSPQVNVLHLTDTLDAGGAECMAVNLVNLLPRERYRPHLCTTRREGVLAHKIAPDVNRLRLARRWRFDLQALNRLTTYIKQSEIKILHAHGTALFVAVLASLRPPHPLIVWHDHYGRCRFDDRPVWLYRFASRQIKGVIAVNQLLVTWARERLRVPASRVRYIPNFALTSAAAEPDPVLPGSKGRRIVCVANFRPEKDHLTLVDAIARVVPVCPDLQVFLVGAAIDPDYLVQVREEIERCGLTKHIFILGPRNDVPAILKACAIGVLSSASEGLPLALLEYGGANLAAIATDVGQCAEVLDEGRAGLLVAPGDPVQLATALVSLLQSAEQRLDLATRFRRRIEQVYSPAAAIQEICAFYDDIIQSAI